MCEPRLGTKRVAALERGESRFRVGRPDARRIDDALGPDLEPVAADEVLTRRPDEPLAVEQRPLGADPGRRHRPARERRSEHREREPGVVLDPVVVDDPAGQALAPEVRRALERARRPEMLGEARRRAARRAGRTGRCRCRRRPGAPAGCRRSGTGTARGSRDAARAGAGAPAPRAPRTRARSGAARGTAGPPWISREERPDVPDAMSRCSTSAARSPRLVASSSAPAPTIPPPTMRTSKRLAGERLEGGCCARSDPRPSGSPPHLPRQGSGGRRAAIRHSTQHRPDDEDRRSGAACGRRSRWASVGSTEVRIAAPSTTATATAATISDLAPRRWPRSAGSDRTACARCVSHDPPRAGSRSARRAPCPRAPRHAS